MNLSYSDWKRHFDAYIADTSDDGIDGAALDLILTLKDIDGEEATDGECLELAGMVLEAWRNRTSHSESGRA